MSELAAGGLVTTGAAAVAGVRAFNRFYTNTIGLLRGKYLDTPYSLTEARILFELAQGEASEVTDLRRTVDIDAGCPGSRPTGSSAGSARPRTGAGR